MKHFILSGLLGLFLTMGGLNFREWQFWAISVTVVLMCQNIRDES